MNSPNNLQLPHLRGYGISSICYMRNIHLPKARGRVDTPQCMLPPKPYSGMGGSSDSSGMSPDTDLLFSQPTPTLLRSPRSQQSSLSSHLLLFTKRLQRAIDESPRSTKNTFESNTARPFCNAERLRARGETRCLYYSQRLALGN